MEKNFDEYIRTIDDMLLDSEILDRMGILRPLGHFSKEADGIWHPADYKGYTLITPVFPDDDANAGTYQILLQAKKQLVESANMNHYVEAPASALHMTAARLVSGDAFVEKDLGRHETEFLEAMRNPKFHVGLPKELNFEIRGLSVLTQGIVAAMVAPVHNIDYAMLQHFRDAIYTDETLRLMGVARKRGFQGHITLLYCEGDPTETERRQTAETIISLNRHLFSHPLPFRVHAVEVRRFDHYLAFHKQGGWPVFRFGEAE